MPGLSDLPGQPNQSQDAVKALEAAVAAINRSINGVDTGKLQAMFEKITGSVKEWNESIDRTVDDMKIMLDFMGRAAQINQNLEMGGKARNQEASIEAELKREEKHIDDERIKQGDSIFTKLKREYELTQEMYALDNKRLSTAYQTADVVARAATNVESIMPQILSSIPFGGLLGFMLAGAAKEAQFTADTQKVAQSWKVVGASASEFGRDIEHMLKDFKADAIATTEELVGIAKGFAEMGIQAKSVLTVGDTGTNMLKNMGIEHDSIFKVTLALDKLNQTAAGTFAHLAGVAVRDFDNDLNESIKDLVEYGAAAQNAGQNTMTFLNSIMQNAQQLKLYGLHLGDVADATLKVTKMNHDQGFGAGFSGQMAQAGVGQMMSGISGMSDGLAAHIGGKVLTGLHGAIPMDPMDRTRQMSGVGMMLEFQRGGRDLPPDEHRKFYATTIAELGKLANDSGLKGLDREFLLKSFGFGQEGSHVIMQLFDKMGGKMDPSKLNDGDQKRLNDALMSESEKTDAVRKLLENLKIAVADIGNGLLGMILASLKVVIQGLQYGFDAIVHKLGGGNKTDEDIAAEYKQLTATVSRVGQYGAQFGEGMRRAGHGLGNIAKTGALSEFGDILLHGADKMSPTDDGYTSGAKADFSRLSTQAWRDAIDEQTANMPSWMRSLIQPKVEGQIDPDSMNRLASAPGMDPARAQQLSEMIENAYQQKRKDVMPQLKLKYDGLDDVVGFSVYFHKADGSKGFDGGAGGR
jgi:hypothetical protein